MKKRSGIILAAVALVALLSHPTPTSAGFGFEDPQLCVDGVLLTVIPASPGEVYVSVPVGTAIDYEVANCSGTEQPLPESNVRYYALGEDDDPLLKVKVDTAPDLAVNFIYGARAKTRITNDNGIAKARFRLGD